MGEKDLELELHLELYPKAKENLQKVIEELSKNPKAYGKHINNVYYLMGIKRAVKELLKEDMNLERLTEDVIKEIIEDARKEMLKEMKRLEELKNKQN